MIAPCPCRPRHLPSPFGCLDLTVLERAGKVVRGKEKVVSDGPYVEAKDLVLGFIVVEARDLAQAVELRAIEDRDRLASYPFYPAAMAELELRRGNREAARMHFSAALELARNPAERRFLEKRVRTCGRPSGPERRGLTGPG